MTQTPVLTGNNGGGGGSSGVVSYNGRTGAVLAQAGDYTASQVGAAPLASPGFTGVPTAPTATGGTNTIQIATTAFVINQAATTVPLVDGTATVGTSTNYARADHVHPSDTTRAPLVSPGFTGVPTAPTATTGTNTTQIATTAFVEASVAASTSGVSTYNGRTGAVVPVSGDYTVSQVTGAAPLASPGLTGTPTAPTATTGTNTTQIATTAFTTTAVATETTRATTAEGLLAAKASPALTGTPTAPTAATNTNTTQIATTAFVLAQASSTTPAMDSSAAIGTSFSYARADHVHPSDTTRAPIASPTFTGSPSAPTPTAGDNDTSIATTAFVTTALNGVAQISEAIPGNMGSAYTLAFSGPNLKMIRGTLNANLTITVTPIAAGYQALITLTQDTTGGRTVTVTDGTNSAVVPVASAASASSQILVSCTDGTTVDIQALGGSGGGGTSGVSSFNTRTGAVTPTTGDYTVSQVTGAAPLASPALTGTPTVPTATAGTNTTQAASTAFVAASFSPIASPTFTGTPSAPTATAGTNTTQIATTAFVAGSYAPLASPTLTGTPIVPTAAVYAATTQAASTAFVQQAMLSPVKQTNTTVTTLTITNGQSLASCTAQASALTVTTSGSFTDGQRILIRIKATGAYAITWNSIFVASGVATLPTTTVSGKTITIDVIYDGTAAKLICLATDSVGY